MPYFFFLSYLSSKQSFSPAHEKEGLSSLICATPFGFCGCWLQLVGQSLAMDG